jgi:hypothetical protein
LSETTRSRKNSRASSWTSVTHASQGLLEIRLFTPQDIPALTRKAQKPLASGVTPDKVAEGLNLAFYGAYVASEQQLLSVPRRALNCQLLMVKRRAEGLLRALDLPTKPRSYTQEDLSWRLNVRDDPFCGSPVGTRLKAATQSVLPAPPSKLKLDVTESLSQDSKQRIDKAVAQESLIRLHERAVAASIAELSRAYGACREWLLEATHATRGAHVSLARMRAQVSVRLLLDTAPSAIALLITLAELAGADAAVINSKPNYRRTFRRVLFRLLARAYFDAFRQKPDILDNDREPGPATQWVRAVLRLAARESERIALHRVDFVELGTQSERARVQKEIKAVATLKAVQNPFGSAWRSLKVSA